RIAAEKLGCAGFGEARGAGVAASTQLEALVEEAVAVEERAPDEAAPREQPRQPRLVVGPHPRVGDPVDLDPERRRVVGLARLADAAARGEDEAVQAQAVDELEADLAARLDTCRCHSDLLFDLADRARERGLAGLELPARSVDLARAEPALLVDQEHAPSADDEEQRRAHLRG